MVGLIQSEAAGSRLTTQVPSHGDEGSDQESRIEATLSLQTSTLQIPDKQ